MKKEDKNKKNKEKINKEKVKKDKKNVKKDHNNKALKIKTKNNNKDKKVKDKKRKKKINIKFKLKTLLLALLILGIFLFIGMIAFLGYIVISAPDFDESLLYVSNPTVVVDANGTELAKLGTEKRITITYDEMSEVLIDAIVATEDSRFFEHNGVDWARFLKASFYQLLGKSEAGGASTITMQVSKNTYTSNEDSGIKGIIRKFTDVYVSMFKIEKNYSKEQIMEFYVNSHYLGRNAYGVEQVSLNYFNKSVKDLNVSEAALIAGLFQAPGRYDPYKNPDLTESRRQTVLKLMLRHGYISKDEYNIAKKMTVEKIVIPQEESSYASSEISKYQGFIDTVVEEVVEKTGKNPYTTSMIIYTTIDTGFQDYINDIMFGNTYEWENDIAQAGIAVISVNDGSIVALGSYRTNDAIDKFNFATDIENQIGSTAKPLYDYGPAIEYNNWSTYHILVDEPISYSDGTPINNWNGGFEGFETMRTALRGSRNIPALKTFKQNNKQQVTEFVTNLGLNPEIYSCPKGYKRERSKCINKKDATDIIDATIVDAPHEAHSIGGYNGESPLTMAAAYNAFPSKGIYTKPYSFTKLVYQDTGEEFVNDIETTKAMSEETAYMISDMLATTAPQAMGGYYNINGIRYAAKTGTTNYDEAKLAAHNLLYTDTVNDLWTIAFNTEYTIAVWYGYDSLDETYHNRLGSAQHERLMQAVGRKVFTNGNYFTQPSGVVAVELESGCPEEMYPSEYTPSDLRQVELFIKGTEPSQTSTRFAKLNDVSNLKATTTNNKIKLTWDKVQTPQINTESYLKEIFSKNFENTGYLNSYVNARLEYNKNYIGNIGYNVYLKDKNNNLTLLDFVEKNEYTYDAKKSGDYTFVVKTAYSIFKNNMSSGKNVSATVKVSESPIIIEEKDKEQNTNNNENNENNNNDNNNSNTPSDDNN